MNIETVNELIQSLESAGELSIKEAKVMALAKAYVQLAAENVGLKEYRPEPYGIAMMEALDAFFADEEVPERAMMVAFETLCAKRMPVPATDRIVAGIKADGVEEYAELFASTVNMEREHNQQFHKGTLWFAQQLREGAK
ncbi:hypothetical protein [Klebsiella grimontii]|uniref:hypothetical protein n=1 Tax=Klebsiella grimontii TaxID=2058152 RepID=UPI001E4C66D6|nr:hypothetical protein [Klebsiella grimontii]